VQMIIAADVEVEREDRDLPMVTISLGIVP